MLYKIKLKNSDKEVLLDGQVYEQLNQDPYLKELKFLEKLRLHSSGCCVFQKNWTQKGKSKVQTIYLHKLVAERFLSHLKTEKLKLVGAKNGNKLDCRLENLEWRSLSISARNKKIKSKTGFKGVYKEKNRYRAIITYQGKTIHIGMFKDAVDAARAYNKKAKELYGEKVKQNNLYIRPESKKTNPK